MSPADKNLAKQYRLRAAIPKYVKFGTIAAIGVALLVVAIGFYRERSKASFRLKGEHAQLSKDVIAEVNGYGTALLGIVNGQGAVDFGQNNAHEK